MSFILFVGSLIGDEVKRLDSPRFETREAAHARLKFAGLFAVPALLGGTRSESPEVRARCQSLLARWRNLWWNLEAARVLTAKDMPDPVRFFENHRLRLHVFRMAERAGCGVCDGADPFLSEWFNQWELTPESLAWVLQQFREQLKHK